MTFSQASNNRRRKKLFGLFTLAKIGMVALAHWCKLPLS